MIKIDPLYLLLLVELVCLLAGGLIFLLLRYKKYRAMYQSAIKDLVAAQHREQELQKQLVHARESVAAAPAPAPSGPTATLSLQNAQEIDDLKTKLQETEDSLREKKRKLEQLESKFADLEKEYMVLYQQQQNQQNQPDI
jgi:septal ring factor EnvC (AmiA/AmiB activator)